MNSLLSKRLKYFVVAMETKCINEAAQRLFITRTPLGRILSELEEHAGGALFTKKYNELIPTPLAYHLYEKVKPVYDTLCSVEDEFNHKHGTECIEIIFDISIPYTSFNYLKTRLESCGYPVNTRRASITSRECFALSRCSKTVLFTSRGFHQDQDILSSSMIEQPFVAVIPSHLTLADMLDSEKMMNIALFINKDEFSNELKGRMSQLLSNVLPYTPIKETNMDISSQLFSVSAGEGIVLLTEHLSSFFHHPQTAKVKLPGITFKSALYWNKAMKNTMVIDKLIEEFSVC